MPNLYFDNAATTPIRQEVREYMHELLDGPFGNPSSTHAFGRKSRALIEQARKQIASALHCQAGEIIFTSGGTEADNMALYLSVRDLGVKHIITSALEHHAVLQPAEAINRRGQAKLHLVRHNSAGDIDLEHLEELLLQCQEPVLVSLMHGNNEIGNLLDLKAVADLSKKHGAYLHSDTVQTVGHFPIDLEQIPVDFITASAHKFHGPKGVGFLFARKGLKFASLLQGGAQERNLRPGTENILGIGGLQKALECSLNNLESERQHIRQLKEQLIQGLKEMPGVEFTARSGEMDASLYTVLNVGFTKAENQAMFLFQLDLKGIAASGGSACASGSLQGSHVLAALNPKATHPTVRFSLSKNNTSEEVEQLLEVIREMH